MRLPHHDITQRPEFRPSLVPRRKFFGLEFWGDLVCSLRTVDPLVSVRQDDTEPPINDMGLFQEWMVEKGRNIA